MITAIDVRNARLDVLKAQLALMEANATAQAQLAAAQAILNKLAIQKDIDELTAAKEKDI